jgi:putative ABC transport system permease protein
MRVFATFRIALRALRRNKMRTLLTMLGIIFGVAAVITTVSLGRGAKAMVEAQVASLGQNVLQVFPGSLSTGGARGGWGSRSTLTPEDAQAVLRETPNVVAVSCEVRDRSQILANGLNWNTQVLGESPEYLSVRSWELSSGAMFTDADVRSAAKVCILGKTVVDQLFSGEDPVGQTIRIRDIPFKILGVLQPKGFNFFGQDQDDTVIIPYTSSMRRFSGNDYLRAILIQVDRAENMDRIQEEVTALLQQRRGNREPDFTIRSQAEIANVVNESSKTMRSLLAAIATVSLIVGGIGVMNIMLVSVTERTREIGIRMAIGARGHDVMLQFLIEACTLSTVGGGLGVLFGLIASKLLTYLKQWPTLTPMEWVIAAFATSAIVGIVFGFYPARKASRLDPIEALRYE